MLDELRNYAQWVCYRYPNKQPLRIKDGWGASVSNPSDWSTYDEAIAFKNAYPDYGIGFVLTENDPFTVIDLDNPKDEKHNFTAEQIEEIYKHHSEVYERFQTYAELSPSGAGCHLWAKGNVEARKVSSLCLEVYSNNRYITVTNNSIRSMPIQESQTLLNELIESLDAVTGRNKNSAATFESQPEVETDEQILSHIQQSKQAAVFYELYTGNYRGIYNSQSEADLALVNIIAFWTNNKEQVARMFRASELGKRKKAQRDEYLFNPEWGIVTKSFDQKINPALFAEIIEEIKQHVEKKLEKIQAKQAAENYDWPLPDGLLGDITKFIYNAAIYPSQEVALSAAIAFMAGLTGRCYNTVTGTGLNQYVVLVAGTAQGKEGAASGISKLTKPLLANNPTLIDCIGPSVIASPQALIKHLVQAKSLFCHINEVGFWLQSLNAKWAKSNEKMLKALILALFQKSGESDILQGSIYADKSNNVPSIKAPAFSILGDSTPEEFYKAIDEQNIAEGLVSRFTIIPARDIRPIYNASAASIEPTPELIKRMNVLIKTCVDWNMTNSVCKVIETPEAEAFQLQYQKDCQDKVWNDRQAPESKIWQRAHVRLLRLGALCAVGRNAAMPTVTLEDYHWAEIIVNRGVQAVANKFALGEVGEESPYLKQKNLIREAIIFYYRCNSVIKVIERYSLTDEMVKNHIMPFAYIQNKTIAYACFKNDRNPAMALRNQLEEMEKSGVLERLSNLEVVAMGKRGSWYRLLDPTLIVSE